MPSAVGREAGGGGGAHGHRVHREAGGPQAPGRGHHGAGFLGGHVFHLLGRRAAVHVARVGGDAGQPQARGGVDGPPQQRRVLRRHAQAPAARVHDDEHVHRRPPGCGGGAEDGAEGLDGFDGVHAQRQFHAGGQAQQPLPLPDADERIGDGDVRNAGPGHLLGFVQRGGENAHGAGLHLFLGDEGRLVGFDHGPQRDAVFPGQPGHVFNVAFQHVQVHDGDRRFQLIQQHGGTSVSA